MPQSLRIWQQNTHKSKLAQQYILNTASPNEWDIIAIQEPWLDHFNNARGSSFWRVLYPSIHLQDEASRTRSILLINTNIATDAYSQLDIPNADITAVKFTNEIGSMSIFNIYNDCTHNDNIQALSLYLSKQRPNPEDSMMWLGDFNRHHPIWETEENRHLTSSADDIEPLLDLIRSYDMEQVLPPDTPTFETVTHNWTRPDNVWLSHSALNMLTTCDTDPGIRPIHADHLPIVTVIDLPVARATPKLLPDFHNYDSAEFNALLEEKLQAESPATQIRTKDEFIAKVNKLTSIIQETIDMKVPIRKPCPFSKRWWNPGLSALRKEKNKLSKAAYKFRKFTGHPSKEAHKEANKKFAAAVEAARKSHWTEWLENITSRQVYTANKYATNEPSDYSSARIPTLSTNLNGQSSSASTNLAKTEALASTFFPPPPDTSLVPPNYRYPTPLSGIKFFSRERIKQAVTSLKPHKVPGPDGIPNVVLIKSIDILVDHLFFIYKAVFELNVYHDRWLTSSTLVLRKPSKPSYTVPNAYRPIGLLDTIGKLLSTLVAADITFLAEKHNLLPTNQFGGRPGRNTSDAIHMLSNTVKNAWRSGKVAAALFLDIQGAFPNTCKEQLLHNMKARKIPLCYINLISNMLTNRKTRIIFDDFISDPINIDNGTTQGCPLSMILYAFYNAPLILTASGVNETALGFVDDSMFLTVASSLPEAHQLLKDMMERRGGGFDWSKTHNSPFEPNKLALMNFPRPNSDPPPADLVLNKPSRNGPVTQITVSTANKYKYLGVILEPNLRWTLHHQKVIARATWWTLQIARLSRTSGGLPPKRIRQLYTTVAIPTFTYAADVWFTDIHLSSTGLKKMGSVSLAKKLTSIQRLLARIVTGGLKTTAGDVLEVHANLLPIDLLFKKTLFRASTRLASLPSTHPLYKPIRKAANRYVKKHRSPLHNLFQHTGISPNDIETITAVRRRPNYSTKFSTHIANDKETALATASMLHNNSECSIYTDGSGFENGIGAAAVSYINKVESQYLWFHLGPSSRHTVYEGELIGICLALHILLSLPFNIYSRIVIGSDSQAAIKALTNQSTHPAQYLLDYIHDSAEKLHSKYKGNIDLQIHWTPAHRNFAPNERADELAKRAAKGSSSAASRLPSLIRNAALPSSIPATRHKHLTALRENWKTRWKKSPRYPLSHSIDKSLPSNKFLYLVDKMSRSQSAILTQLRTGHSPLNNHLFRIRCSETPVCPHCGNLTVETVCHFLLQCPQYQQERHSLRRKLKRAANSLSYLLSKPPAIKPLLKFITATKRFQNLSTIQPTNT